MHCHLGTLSHKAVVLVCGVVLLFPIHLSLTLVCTSHLDWVMLWYHLDRRRWFPCQHMASSPSNSQLTRKYLSCVVRVDEYGRELVHARYHTPSHTQWHCDATVILIKPFNILSPAENNAVEGSGLTSVTGMNALEALVNVLRNVTPAFRVQKNLINPSAKHNHSVNNGVIEIVNFIPSGYSHK